MTKKDLIFKYWDKYGLQPKAYEYASLFSIKPTQQIFLYMIEYLGGYEKIEEKLQENFLDQTFEKNEGCGSYKLKFKFNEVYYDKESEALYFSCFVTGSMVFVFSDDTNRYDLWDIMKDDKDDKNWEVLQEVEECIIDFIREISIEAYPISFNVQVDIVEKLK
jgi:hypothetical protein